MIFTPFAFVKGPVTGGGLDPDATAYLDEVTAQGGTFTQTQEDAVYNLFTSLKNANLYSKIKAMYPLVGGTANSHAINACNIGTYTLTFYGGWTHTSVGMSANGSTAYADTGLQVGTAVTVDNYHMSYRQTETSPTNTGWDGYYRSSEGKVAGFNLNTGGQIGLGLWFLAGSIGTLSNYTDVFTGTRTSTTNGILYNNTNAFYTDSVTRSEFSTFGNFFIGCLNENGSPNYYNNNDYNFFTLGDEITSGEITDWSTIWNDYITEMGR